MRCVYVNVERRNGCTGLCNSKLQTMQSLDGLFQCHCIKRHLESSARGGATAFNIDESPSIYLVCATPARPPRSVVRSPPLTQTHTLGVPKQGVTDKTIIGRRPMQCSAVYGEQKDVLMRGELIQSLASPGGPLSLSL